jgi:signal transduction histidine kinase/DNA-binding response OmpR family regulator
MKLFPLLAPYTWVLVAATLVSFYLGMRAWFGTRRELSRNLALFECGVFIWCLFGIIQSYMPSPEERLLAFKLQYLGVAFLPGSAYRFARAIDHRPPGGLFFRVLCQVPGFFIFLASFTNEYHQLMWRGEPLTAPSSVPSPGVLFWILVLGLYLQIGTALVIMIRHAARSSGTYARWIRYLTAFFTLPFLANIVYRMFPKELGPNDPTPVALALFGILFSMALSRFNILDSMPYAKDLILETIDSPFIVTDAEGYVMGGNGKAKATFAPGGILEGRKIAELVPPLQGLVEDKAYRYWSSGGVDYLVTCHVMKIGRKTWRGRMYLFRDVSRQVQASLESAEALAKADAANAAKSAFIAVVSHDLRNPLSAIIGLADLNLRSDLPKALSQDLEVIRSSGNLLLGLVNDLLDLSKIEAGKMELERIDFDLREQVDSILCAFRPVAQGKGVALDASFAEDAPRFVRGDPLRFSQVLMNLVSNAVKFTEAGSIAVELERAKGAPEAAPGDPRSVALRCTVRDTGIGIAPDKLSRLFREFSQADPSVGRRYGGTGLGLSICKKLVALFGGEIGVISREGEGSEFGFTARFEPGDEAAIAKAAEVLAAARGEGVPPAPHALDILIVDDEEVSAAVARRYAERSGNTVASASTGAQAVALAAEREFDLVLLDLGLPDMDGFEAARLIRADPGPGSSPPIAAMTARSDAELRSICTAAGMIDCLAKPIDPVALERLFERIAARARELGPRAAASATMPGEIEGCDARPVEGEVSIEERLIDEEALLKRLRGDRAFMRDLLSIFAEEIRGRREAFESASSARDAEAMMKAAHKLKGSAMSLCALSLSRAAGELEAASASARREGLFDPALSAAAAAVVGLLERSVEEARSIAARIGR